MECNCLFCSLGVLLIFQSIFYTTTLIYYVLLCFYYFLFRVEVSEWKKQWLQARTTSRMIELVFCPLFFSSPYYIKSHICAFFLLLFFFLGGGGVLCIGISVCFKLITTALYHCTAMCECNLCILKIIGIDFQWLIFSLI